MGIRGALTTVAFLAVLAGFAWFASWYWGGGGPPWLEWGRIPTGSAPPATSLSIAGESATPTPIPTPTAASAQAPNCPPGQSPRFVLGFASLEQQVGAPMGEPIECEHADSGGDAEQRTTTGLAYYRSDTNTTAFTDGWHHWAATSNGLVRWEGEASDPPPDAEVVAAPSPG